MVKHFAYCYYYNIAITIYQIICLSTRTAQLYAYVSTHQRSVFSCIFVFIFCILHKAYCVMANTRGCKYTLRRGLFHSPTASPLEFCWAKCFH